MKNVELHQIDMVVEGSFDLLEVMASDVWLEVNRGTERLIESRHNGIWWAVFDRDWETNI